MRSSTGIIIVLLCSLSRTTQAFLPANHRHALSQGFSQHNNARSSRAHAPRPSIPTTSLSMTPSELAGPSLDMNPLLAYFIETLIASGVPALLSIIVIGFAALVFRPRNNTEENLLKSVNPAAQLYNDLYGDQKQSKITKLFPGKSPFLELPKNTGVPEKEFITMKHFNRKLESYNYSLAAATSSKAKAASLFRQASFQRALGKTITPSVAQALQTAEAEFLKQGAKLVAEIQKQQTRLTQTAIDEELLEMGLENAFQLDPPTSNNTQTKKQKLPFNKNDCMNAIAKAQKELQTLEFDFVKQVVQAVGPEQGAAVRTALLGDIAARGSGGLLTALEDRPLTKLVGSSNESKPKLFFTRFPGDATASQVSDLREEVTAIVRSCKPGDEALLILQTGGGTVTGYGLAAAQLLRLKEAGLKLTIAVEQVAASGGYMMCCVADHIVASPFAVLGSIGVISDIPNVYNRLKEEGIEFQTVTAGKYKRTLTPTKKVTPEDFKKTKADVENILVLFRNFVAQNRPKLDIDAVATGETWFGEDALKRDLCDELKTADAVLLDFVDRGYDVYEVDYTPPPEVPQGVFGLLPAGQSAEISEGLVGRAVSWLTRSIIREVKAELSASSEDDYKRYMASDDAVDRFKF